MTDMVQIQCSHCIHGKVRVLTHLGAHIAPCAKCMGRSYRWLPRGMTEGDYDALLQAGGDQLESIIDGLTVDGRTGLD